MSDLRFAFRQLWKSPGFTIAAVVVLALGIGVNTAIFNLVDTLLFSPPPYQNPAEIVQLFSQDKKDPKSFRAFSYPTFRDVRDQNTVFSGVMAHSGTVVGLGEKGNTRRAQADLVSSNYFSVLGIRPAYGREFLPEEEKPGSGQRVAIVSHRYWKKYSRDPALLGHTLLINGRDFTVVGIMPEGLTETESIFDAEVWLPLGVYDEIMNDRGSAAASPSLEDRGRDESHRHRPLQTGNDRGRGRTRAERTREQSRGRVSGRAKRPNLHDLPARSFFQQHRPFGSGTDGRDRRAALGHGGCGFARGLLESGQHVARARDRAAERDRDPSRARRQPRTYR